jgi:hypothetical protein
MYLILTANKKNKNIVVNGVFWVVTPCGSCKNRRFGGLFLRSVHRLLVAAGAVPSSPIFVSLMKEAPGSSETSVLTRATQRDNPEDTILHSHRPENLKSYKNIVVITGTETWLHCDISVTT